MADSNCQDKAHSAKLEILHTNCFLIPTFAPKGCCAWDAPSFSYQTMEMPSGSGCEGGLVLDLHAAVSQNLQQIDGTFRLQQIAHDGPI